MDRLKNAFSLSVLKFKKCSAKNYCAAALICC